MGETRADYSGTHTLIGHLIGKTVLKVMKSGIERWKNRREGLL
jgi:adenosylcobinamide amidohydrolase